MAIPRFEEDMEIISKQGDYPGPDNGLSTQQFKSSFDKAGILIKKYLNETLVPNLNMIVDVQALLNGILDRTLTQSDKAANAKTTGDELNKKLDKTGGDMTGALRMNGQKIAGVAAPTAEGDAANKKYVDDKRFAPTVVLYHTEWTGSSAPFTLTVSVDGIRVEDNPHYGVVYSGDADAKLAQKDAFSMIDDLDTANGSVTFTCFVQKPEIDLTIQLEAIR